MNSEYLQYLSKQGNTTFHYDVHTQTPSYFSSQ